MSDSRLDRVVLAISAYRSDEPVIALLERAFAPGEPRFGKVIVVDSLGSGAVQKTIERRSWPVEYTNADRNLGSAGNLDLRLRLAADTGLDWCLTVNHDGELTPRKSEALVRHGTEYGGKVGAVYPRLRLQCADGRLDRPRTRFMAFGPVERSAPASRVSEVKWSSSNGALYRLAAIREGLTAWPHLWMGYEDLVIGWELERRGYKQLLCSDVEVEDDYELRRIRPFGYPLYIADKPTWFAYYHIRNLALIARQTRGSAVSWSQLALRVAADLALLPFKDQRRTRLSMLFKGLSDAARGKFGKARMP